MLRRSSFAFTQNKTCILDLQYLFSGIQHYIITGICKGKHVLSHIYFVINSELWTLRYSDLNGTILKNAVICQHEYLFWASWVLYVFSPTDWDIDGGTPQRLHWHWRVPSSSEFQLSDNGVIGIYDIFGWIWRITTPKKYYSTMTCFLF